MSDVVVTVPKTSWAAWLAEGDLPGEPFLNRSYYFRVATAPTMVRGDRVYVVSHGRLRGYAPLDQILSDVSGNAWLVRSGGAVAVTIPDVIPGFRGFRYRWWPREDERPFPEWRTP